MTVPCRWDARFLVQGEHRAVAPASSSGKGWEPSSGLKGVGACLCPAVKWGGGCVGNGACGADSLILPHGSAAGLLPATLSLWAPAEEGWGPALPSLTGGVPLTHCASWMFPRPCSKNSSKQERSQEGGGFSFSSWLGSGLFLLGLSPLELWEAETRGGCAPSPCSLHGYGSRGSWLNCTLCYSGAADMDYKSHSTVLLLELEPLLQCMLGPVVPMARTSLLKMRAGGWLCPAAVMQLSGSW